MSELVQVVKIEKRIFTIRGVQVMLDRDVAELYGVETKILNQAVKRNIARFPEQFRFQLTRPEADQLVTNCDRFNNIKHCSFSTHLKTKVSNQSKAYFLMGKFSTPTPLSAT